MVAYFQIHIISIVVKHHEHMDVCVCLCVCDQNKSPIENDRPYNYVLTVNFVVSTSFIAIAAAAIALVIDYYIILRIFGHWKKCVRLLCGLAKFFLVCTRHSMLPNLKHYFIVNETTKERRGKSRKISSLFHLTYSIWAWKSRPLDYFRVLKLLNNNCNHLLKWKSIRMCLTQCSKSNNTLDRFRFLFQFFFRVVLTVSKTLR